MKSPRLLAVGMGIRFLVRFRFGYFGFQFLGSKNLRTSIWLLTKSGSVILLFGSIRVTKLRTGSS